MSRLIGRALAVAGLVLGIAMLGVAIVALVWGAISPGPGAKDTVVIAALLGGGYWLVHGSWHRLRKTSGESPPA